MFFSLLSEAVALVAWPCLLAWERSAQCSCSQESTALLKMKKKMESMRRISVYMRRCLRSEKERQEDVNKANKRSYFLRMLEDGFFDILSMLNDR